MANHKSALKAHRQSLKRRAVNRSNRSALRTALKQFEEKLDSGETESLEAAKGGLATLYKTIDQSLRKKALSRNAAARQKSRLTKKLNAALKPEA
ncbi:MAG: 30S ribosomal protein S20 [Acidobacteriota bacterium]|jgi:small subunit ribosomal protein S20|nr:30S ribosomal protein S20 [Acidobacteriota bacterium]